jgi:hypothetical protein
LLFYYCPPNDVKNRPWLPGKKINTEKNRECGITSSNDVA